MEPGPRSEIRVATKLAQSLNMGRTKSQHESHKVATWVAQSRSMSRAL